MTRADAISDPAAVSDDPAAVRAWLVACAAELMLVAPTDIDSATPLAEYGLDSVNALAFAAEIEDRFDIVLDDDALWTHPSVEALTGMIGTLRPSPATP